MILDVASHNSSLAPALVGAASALSVAVVAAGLGYWRYFREKEHLQDALLNSLFGELANIYEHYTYAARELPAGVANNQLRLKMQWSTYGKLECTKNLSDYGFLGASEIRLLLQLDLRIRNNDRFIEYHLANFANIGSEDLLRGKTRMRSTMAASRTLIRGLVAKRPRLQKILSAIENDLPQVKAT